MKEYNDIKVSSLSEEEYENLKKVIRLYFPDEDVDNQGDIYFSFDLRTNILFLSDLEYNSELYHNLQDFLDNCPELTAKYAKVSTKLGELL